MEAFSQIDNDNIVIRPNYERQIKRWARKSKRIVYALQVIRI